jgi:hypothetical protein
MGWDTLALLPRSYPDRGKLRGCPSQYLPQWINTPKPLHTPMAVGYSWSY